MFNPAYPFTLELLESFMAKEVVHFVKSTYTRGINNEIKGAYLISHYHKQPEAERHYNAIAHDKSRAIYDIRIPADLEKLRKETIPGDTCRSSSKLIHPENEKRATAHFSEHAKRYLAKHTEWDLKGKITIYPKFSFQLGELYVRIAHQGDKITVPFSDIENS